MSQEIELDTNDPQCPKCGGCLQWMDSIDAEVETWNCDDCATMHTVRVERRLFAIIDDDQKEGDKRKFSDGWYTWDGYAWVEDAGVCVGPTEVRP